MEYTENEGVLIDKDHFNLKLWYTPGAAAPYWSANASFRDDYVVATPHDFLEQNGLDCFSEYDPDDGIDFDCWLENLDDLTIEIDLSERYYDQFTGELK